MGSKVANYDGEEIPQGFILNDAGMYSFVCQTVYPDILSFIYAIPNHLKPLFLIPIRVEMPAAHFGSDGVVHVANRIARSLRADDISPSGDTPEGDLFSYNTFNYNDLEPTVAPSEPGSIFDIDGADEKTHTQDLVDNQDNNIQPDTDTSFLSDIDLTELNLNYPYRTPERPIRHSFDISIIVPRKIRYALMPQDLETRTPENIKDNANHCSVNLLSYDKRSRIFSFAVNCGNGRHTVKAKLNDLNHIALNCSCPFWRWNGPEFHASQNNYLLGAPAGKASPPDVRDADRQFHLCKHAYSVVARMDKFVEDVEAENWGVDEDDVLAEVDEDWDKMKDLSEADLEDVQGEDEVEADVEETPELEEYDDSEEETQEMEVPESDEDSDEEEESEEEESEEDFEEESDVEEPEETPEEENFEVPVAQKVHEPDEWEEEELEEEEPEEQ